MGDSSNRFWRSAGRFAGSAATPLAHIGRAAQWVTLGLAILGLVGFGIFASPWAWVALLVLVAALAVWAGVRLQLAEDARHRPAFSVQLDYLRSRGQSSVKHQEVASLWAIVENRGPASEFLGRIRDVTGIENPGGGYGVEAIAWEYGRDQDRFRIERNGRQRLRLGQAVRSGPISGEARTRSLRFFIPHAGMWGDAVPSIQGMGMELTPTEKVTFRLEIVNATEDVQRDYTVMLLFDPDATVADFRIVD